jgi:hypothetical protein
MVPGVNISYLTQLMVNPFTNGMALETYVTERRSKAGLERPSDLIVGFSLWLATSSVEQVSRKVTNS